MKNFNVMTKKKHTILKLLKICRLCTVLISLMFVFCKFPSKFSLKIWIRIQRSFWIFWISRTRLVQLAVRKEVPSKRPGLSFTSSSVPGTRSICHCRPPRDLKKWIWHLRNIVWLSKFIFPHKFVFWCCKTDAMEIQSSFSSCFCSFFCGQFHK